MRGNPNVNHAAPVKRAYRADKDYSFLPPSFASTLAPRPPSHRAQKLRSRAPRGTAGAPDTPPRA